MTEAQFYVPIPQPCRCHHYPACMRDDFPLGKCHVICLVMAYFEWKQRRESTSR